jgi:hypothetical protein
MQSFCKLLYSSLIDAVQKQEYHRNLSVNQEHRFYITKDTQSLPKYILQELQAESKYIAQSVIQYPNIFNTYKHVVRVIPESGTRIDVMFLSGKHCIALNKKDIDEIAYYIELYVRLLEQLSQVRHKTIEIVLLPTKFKKILDVRQKLVLGKLQVNTGVCYKGLFPFIFIYRHEELLKVILHELLHYYKFDYYETPGLSSISFPKFSSKYKIKTDEGRLALNESFNDALTLTIYIGVYIQKNKSSAMNQFSSFIKEYRLLYATVINYVSKLSYMLLLYAQYYYKGYTVENSHAFSYYHGKAALLSNQKRWFDFLKQNLRLDTNDKITNYVSFLEECLDSRIYKNALKANDDIQLFSNLSNIWSLRMCHLELIKK